MLQMRVRGPNTDKFLLVRLDFEMRLVGSRIVGWIIAFDELSLIAVNRELVGTDLIAVCSKNF